MTDEPAGEPDPATGPDSGKGSDSSEGADVTADQFDGESAAGSPSETPTDPEAYTTDTRTLDARVRWLWIGRALLFGLLVGGVATAVAFAVDQSWLWVGPLLFVLVAGIGVVHSILLYRSWSYEVREDSLFLDRGVITRVQTVVPYVRVQHIDTSRGPIERAAGLSTLVVYTAGSRGADVTIPGLTPPEADDLQARLKVLAIESEGEDAV
jgi:membrane protein YdbS with pleckstrin-like domain